MRPGYSAGRHGGRAMPRGWSRVALFAAAAASAVAVVLVFPVNAAGPSPVSAPVPLAILRELTQIPEVTWARIGGRGATLPVRARASGASAPSRTVVYVGAEFCPYCAAQRWPLIVALSRFGTFSGLALATSSPGHAYPSTPTFTFAHATYHSAYVTFAAQELDATVTKAGRYPALQELMPAHADAFHENDPDGSIPFLLIGGRYLWLGSSLSPALLQGDHWAQVAAGLPGGHGATAVAILANAVEMIAAVCAADGGRPASVCHSSPVVGAAKTLP